MKINESEEILKRIIDVFGSLVCIIIFSPVFIVAPILIKLDSKGPVFFKQERAGKDGKYFIAYKFRTMTYNADEVVKKKYSAEELSDLIFQEKNDPRITRIGKILRRGLTNCPNCLMF